MLLFFIDKLVKYWESYIYTLSFTLASSRMCICVCACVCDQSHVNDSLIEWIVSVGR